MDTRNLDLGLLVTLEALLAERNVTRAARRLNLSQPALSARLARLRDALGDPLLIPAQRGMVLTQRALELSTSGFLIVPEVVSRSDMIALIPRRIAEGWSDRVQVLEPPLTIPGFVIASIWHERTTTHPAQSWLRDRLAALA